MNIEYPETETTKLNDGRQFVAALAQITKDKVADITFNAFGPVTIYFKDGTSCGGRWIWEEVVKIIANQ